MIFSNIIGLRPRRQQAGARAGHIERATADGGRRAKSKEPKQCGVPPPIRHAGRTSQFPDSRPAGPQGPFPQGGSAGSIHGGRAARAHSADHQRGLAGGCAAPSGFGWRRGMMRCPYCYPPLVGCPRASPDGPRLFDEGGPFDQSPIRPPGLHSRASLDPAGARTLPPPSPRVPSDNLGRDPHTSASGRLGPPVRTR